MKPKKFPEVNVTYAENQPEYLPLPVFKDKQEEGLVVSCWGMTWRERFTVLFKGEIWLSVMTYHQPLTPVNLFAKKSEILIVPKKPTLFRYFFERPMLILAIVVMLVFAVGIFYQGYPVASSVGGAAAVATIIRSVIDWKKKRRLT